MMKLNGIYNKVGKNIKVEHTQENLSKFDQEADVMLDNGVWYSEKNEINTIHEQGIF